MGLSAATLAGLGTGIDVGSQFGGGILAYTQSGINAEILKERGRQAAAQSRREGNRIIGAQIARYAVSGVDPGTGSAADVIRSTDEQERIRALRLKFEGEDAARIEKRAGLNALINSIFGGSATLLGQRARMKEPPADLSVDIQSTYQLPATGGPMGGTGRIALPRGRFGEVA